jgi:hypothetical protein
MAECESPAQFPEGQERPDNAGAGTGLAAEPAGAEPLDRWEGYSLSTLSIFFEHC